MRRPRAAGTLLARPGQTEPRGGERKNAMKDSSIKVGVIADQTGPLSFVGVANANVARW